MTIEEMRALVGLGPDATDAAVVLAFAAMVDNDELEPPVEPVTVEQARMQCGIEDEIDDGFIAGKITAAREVVEDLSGQVLAQRSLAARFTSWGRRLEIFKRPVRAIDAIAYDGIDAAALHSSAAIASGGYPYRIYSGASGWPRLRDGGGVTVVYTAGYTADRVPARYREAILVLVAGMIGDRDGRYAQSLAAAKALCSRRPSIL